MRLICRCLFIIAAIGFFALVGCRKNSFSVDVSGINVDISVNRMEQEFFTQPFDQKAIQEKAVYFNEKYGDFFKLYSSSYLNNFGEPGSELYAHNVLSFITNYRFHNIYEETQLVFPDLEEFEKGLEKAFQHYKYYFPERTLPKVITCIFNTPQSVAVDKGVIALSIDKYLGSDCEIYSKAGFENYKIKKMHPGKMLPDIIQSLASTEFEIDDSINNLLNNIIHEGKIMYFMDAMLPKMHDTLKFGFTNSQLIFCEDNEAKMWGTLIEHQLLFSQDMLTIRKYVGDGPFTTDFTKASPARASVWLGRQIVLKYMKKNPDVTLEQLMNNTDYQSILRESGYNPR